MRLMSSLLISTTCVALVAGCVGDTPNDSDDDIADPLSVPLELDGKSDFATGLINYTCSWEGKPFTFSAVGGTAAAACGTSALIAVVVTGGAAAIPACIGSAARSVGWDIFFAATHKAVAFQCNKGKAKARALVPCESKDAATTNCY
jgi:hypothetical protein